MTQRICICKLRNPRYSLLWTGLGSHFKTLHRAPHSPDPVTGSNILHAFQRTERHSMINHWPATQHLVSSPGEHSPSGTHHGSMVPSWSPTHEVDLQYSPSSDGQSGERLVEGHSWYLLILIPPPLIFAFLLSTAMNISIDRYRWPPYISAACRKRCHDVDSRCHCRAITLGFWTIAFFVHHSEIQAMEHLQPSGESNGHAPTFK